jgi:hypothetical protein
VQAGGDLLVRAAVGNELQDLPIARRQRFAGLVQGRQRALLLP